MNSLLDALQEGRLFELPDNNKIRALQFLAHIIEAFPQIPAGTDVVGLVLKREEAANTGLGRSWAFPHARVPYEEDLMCVIGWSPTGIDYAAPDGRAVSLIVMHLVPDNQRSHYLKEISLIAKALTNYSNLDQIMQAKNLDDVRLYLLDLIESTKTTAIPETRARMITLQNKPTLAVQPLPELSNLIIEPLTIISGPDIKPVILSQNLFLTEQLEKVSNLAEKLESEGLYQEQGWRIIRRSALNYQKGRMVYDCIALKLLAPNSARSEI